MHPGAPAGELRHQVRPPHPSLSPSLCHTKAPIRPYFTHSKHQQPLPSLFPARPDPSGFLRGIAISFVCLNVGYLLMALAPNILWLLLATALRAQGSTVLWTYSTLILQLRCVLCVLFD